MRGWVAGFLLCLLLPTPIFAAPRTTRTEFDRAKLDVRRKVRNQALRTGELAEHDSSAAIAQKQSTEQRRQAASDPDSVLSSLAPWTAPYIAAFHDTQDFYDFGNVMLRNDSVVFFQAGDTPVPGLPSTLRLSRYEQQIELPVHVYTSLNRSQAPVCRRWSSRPGLLFSGTLWDDNINEFFVTTLMPLFQTATMTGLLQPELLHALMEISWSRFTVGWDDARTALLNAVYSRLRNAPFLLVSGRPTFFGSPWAYHIKYLTSDTALLADMQGLCFKRLVVSEDAPLRFLYERNVEMQDPGYVAYRNDWLHKYQRHIFSAEELQAMIDLQFSWVPPAPDRLPGKPVQLTLSTRSVAARRAILNEAELLEFVRSTWPSVKVVSTDFRMPLRDAITLMQDTDILMGMHGAGLTNAFWQRPGAVFVQLFPYGWLKPGGKEGETIRTGLSKDIPLSLNGSYFQWVNPIRENGQFDVHSWNRSLNRWDAARWGQKPEAFQEQPSAGLKLPTDHDPPDFWIYQNTNVDLKSIKPVLEAAMQAAGVQSQR